MRFRKLLLTLIAPWLVFPVAAFAQYTSVTATNIQNVDGTPLASGSLCVTPVNASGAPTPFRVGGAGGQVVPRPRCFVVTAGSIGAGNRVPDAVLAYPQIGYQVQIADQTGYPIANYTSPISITGTSWSFDTYQPPSITWLSPANVATVAAGAPTGTCQEPSLYFQSDSTAGGNLWSCIGGAWIQQAGVKGNTGATGPIGATGPPATFMGVWSSTITYSAGQQVSFAVGGVYSTYASLVSANLNNTPSSSPTDWALATTGGTANPAGSAGTMQVSAGSGLFGAATPFNVGSTVIDSQSNLFMTNNQPTHYPFPAGYSQSLFIGANSGLAYGDGVGTTTEAAIGIGVGALQNAGHCNDCIAIGVNSANAYTGTTAGGVEDGDWICIGGGSCEFDAGLTQGGSGAMFEITAVGHGVYGGTGAISSNFIGAHNSTVWTGGSENIIEGANTAYCPTCVAGVWMTGSQDVVIGANSYTPQLSAGNIAAGTYTSTNQTIVGATSGGYAENTSGNTGVGQGIFTGGSSAALMTGTYNTALGVSACRVVSSGSANVCIGSSGAVNGAGVAVTTGSDNTLVGALAGSGITTSSNSTLVGYRTGGGGLTVPMDAFGFEAGLFNTTGANNAFFAFNAGGSNTTGSDNTFVGFRSGQTQTTASFNTFVGTMAGEFELTGNNTCVGYQSCGQGTAGTPGNNTGIGYQAGFINPGNATATNDVWIGQLANCNGCTNSVMVGKSAVVSPGLDSAAQVGTGTNSHADTLQYMTINFLDTSGNAEFKTVSLGVGTAIASAATIAPTSAITHITGTTAIATITVPTVLSGGGTFTGCVKLIPDALWTTVATGNIALASIPVVGRVLEECYDGTKWYPSY